MSTSLFTQTIDTAFEETVGNAGASRAVYQRWRDQLVPSVSDIRQQPAREAAPIFALPERTDDLAEIESVASHIASSFSTLVVAGMGGSSLSGEVLAPLGKQTGPALHFVDNVDPHTLEQLCETLPWPQTAFLVISKSGNTVETQAHMAIFLAEAKKRGLDVAKHFFVLTIPNENPLHRLATEHSMRVIAHEADLGGRFSTLSVVGLIPAAVVGVDIRALRSGAVRVLADNFSGALPAAVDAAALNVALMEKHIPMQVLIHYSDRLSSLAMWQRQCWAESLGKAGKGTTPIPSRGVTDQHGQLQLYLEGPKDKFFTSLIINSAGQGAPIGIASSDARLSYLSGHTVGDLAYAEQKATLETLVKAGCPLRTITAASLNAETLGGLLMHFMLEIIFTAHLLGVNAFDQPAVETGKRLTLEYLKKNRPN